VVGRTGGAAADDVEGAGALTFDGRASGGAAELHAATATTAASVVARRRVPRRSRW
jgi:hypothetical protein